MTGGRAKRRKKKKKGGGEGSEKLQDMAMGMAAIPLVGDVAAGVGLATAGVFEAASVIGDAFDWF